MEPIKVITALAGTPADHTILIDVQELLAASCTDQSDAALAEQRVMFGTAGHRGCSLDNSFNEAQFLAITEAICAYRQKEDKQLFRARLWSQCESAHG